MNIFDVLIVDLMILLFAYLWIKAADFCWWLSWLGKKDEMEAMRRELLEDSIVGLQALMSGKGGDNSSAIFKKTKSNSRKLMPPSKRVKTMIIDWLQ